MMIMKPTHYLSSYVNSSSFIRSRCRSPSGASFSSHTAMGEPTTSRRPSLMNLSKLAEVATAIQKESSCGSKADTLYHFACKLREEVEQGLREQLECLERLPGVAEGECHSSLKQATMQYRNFLGQMKLAPVPDSDEKEAQFAGMMSGLRQRALSIGPEIPKGLFYLRRSLKDQGMDMSSSRTINFALQQFYFSQHGTLSLLDHYAAARLPAARGGGRPGFAGALRRDLPLGRALGAVKEDALFLAGRHADRLRRKWPRRHPRPRVPAIIVQGELDSTVPAYPPDDLHYILLELAKNSLKAVTERYSLEEEEGFEPPAVHMHIIDTPENEDIVIKVYDRGGGIPRRRAGGLFRFLVSGSPEEVQEQFLTTLGSDLQQSFTSSSPLAGLGVGLPLARARARAWGGDVQLASVHGEETTAYVYLSKEGNGDYITGDDSYYLINGPEEEILHNKKFGVC